MDSRTIYKIMCWVAIFFFLFLERNIICGTLVNGNGNDNGDITTTLKLINVGVIIDLSTRVGKEQEVGMKVAAEDFNSKISGNITVNLHILSSNSSNPLRTAHSAISLINKTKVEVIITGTDNLDELPLLGEIGNQYKVPIISLSAAYLNPMKTRSFVVHFSDDYTVQIDCITSLIKTFGWKKVIAVYEDDGYGSSASSMLDIFSNALQDIDSEIEYRLALPPLSFASNPKQIIVEELVKVFNMQSRVFVILHSSLPLVVQFFKEANNMGLVRRDSAWIITNSIASLLDSLNSSTISYMEGTLGIQVYYDENSENYANFRRKFLLKFLTLYPSEESFHCGVQALRAYDAITIVTKTMQTFPNNKSISSKMLLERILSSKYTGLSGVISIKDGTLDKNDILYRIVNVVGKSYKSIKLWPLKSFSENNDISTMMLNGMVNWPGYVKDTPKGWTMPTNIKPLKVGVPGDPPFDNFVVVTNDNQNKTKYTGFCIDVFLESIKIIEESYSLPFEFEVFYGTYDELVDRVNDKTYDIAVGDITILANRSNFVKFTQPYTQSGLSMIVPLESKESQKTLMFLRPFTWQLWLVTLGTLLYTTLVVWCIESRVPNNSDFQGGLAKQFNTALWFTFCSIFHAQRENIQSNLTRATIIVWFFVVFALISSYTASLTSMLTVPLLEPNKVKDVDWLKNTHSTVGCDGGSVWDYLVNVLDISSQNIINVSSQYDYKNSFTNGTIVSAFLERPYQKLLVNQYCKSYTRTKETFGFCGQGFVFQKGSPIVGDVSRAMLKLTEEGILKRLEDKWFPISSECLTSSNDHDVERLNPSEFLALYLIHVVISMLCFFSYVVKVVCIYLSNTIESRIANLLANWKIKFLEYIHLQSQSNSQISGIEIVDMHQTDDSITLEVSA